jgi:hypothetical protein
LRCRRALGRYGRPGLTTRAVASSLMVGRVAGGPIYRPVLAPEATIRIGFTDSCSLTPVGACARSEHPDL